MMWLEHLKRMDFWRMLNIILSGNLCYTSLRPVFMMADSTSVVAVAICCVSGPICSTSKLSRGKLLPQSDLRERVFLGETSRRRYDKKEFKEQKEYRSYKIGTWNVRTLNQGGKLEIENGNAEEWLVYSRCQWSAVERTRWNKKWWLYSVLFRRWKGWKRCSNSGA